MDAVGAKPKEANALVEDNLGFVGLIANEYRNRGLAYEDLLAEGRLGMVLAAGRFDPARGVKFVTYAVWWVRKTILLALDRQTRAVRVPDHRLRALRSGRIGAGAGTRQAAGSLRMRPRNVAAEDLHRTLGRRTISLDERREGEAGTLGDRLPANGPGPDEVVGRAEASRICDRLLGRLTDRERTLLAHRFGLEGRTALPLKELGRRMGVSHEQVRKSEQLLLARLRTELESRLAV